MVPIIEERGKKDSFKVNVLTTNNKINDIGGCGNNPVNKRIKKDEVVADLKYVHNDFLPHYYDLHYQAPKKIGTFTSVISFFKRNKEDFPGIHSFRDDENSVGYQYIEEKKDIALQIIIDFSYAQHSRRY